MKRFLTLLLIGLIATLTLYAQDTLPSNPPPASVPAPAQTTTAATPVSPDDIPVNSPAFNANATPTRTLTEVYLSIGILVFGAIITVALLYLLASRTKSAPSSEFIDAIRYPIVIVIIIGSIFLVTAGYNTNQMAPILGLMGTIAGYLMGRSKQTG